MNKFLIAAIATATILPSALPSAAMAKPFDRHDTRIVVVDHRAPLPAKRIAVGQRVEPGFIARHSAVNAPARYHLHKAGANARWLKVRDDAVLVNLRTGRIIDIVYRLF